MRIDLVTGDGMPIYQQIVNQITFQVAAGLLAHRFGGSADPQSGRSAGGEPERGWRRLTANWNASGCWRRTARRGRTWPRRRLSLRGRRLLGCCAALLNDAHSMGVSVNEVLDLIRNGEGEGGR